MTNIFNWSENINQNELDYCVDIIKNGGIAVFPTETVYGIGTNAFCKESVKKIYEIKERPEEKPLSILLYNKKQISDYAIISNDIERKIIESFMPGPITIILKRKEGVLDYITSGKNTIGVRIPNNKIILEILKKLKLPMVAPSANISGEPSGVVLSDILGDFNGKVDVCIDGGKCEISAASTIVQIVDNDVKILREGKISKEKILEVIKR